MITPTAARLRETRGDFKDLRPLMPVVHLGATGLPGTVTQLESPEGEAVTVLRIMVATADLAPILAQLLAVMETKADTHVIVESHEPAEEGFDAALDAATEGKLKITLVRPEPPDPEIEGAVASVPRPEGKPSVPITLEISEEDVDRLADKYSEGERKGRLMDHLIPLGGDETVGTQWKLLYWVRGGWGPVVLVRGFFDYHQIPYQLARDPSDSEYEFAFLTDHETPMVRLDAAQDALRAQMERAKAEASGDELAALYAAESFDKGDS